MGVSAKCQGNPGECNGMPGECIEWVQSARGMPGKHMGVGAK